MASTTTSKLLLLFCCSVTGTSATTLALRRSITTDPTNSLTANAYGTVFDVEVQVGDQTFPLLFDTGSADLWIIEPDFRCMNQTWIATLPQDACEYTNPFRRSPTFEPVTDEVFAISLGAGLATGTVGLDDVTIGNITVSKQKIAQVNATSIGGQGLSGIIGFGYPILTSVHPSNFSLTNQSFLSDKLVYNPFFNNAYEQGLVEPYFSVALERLPPNTTSGPGGFLSLGSLPPVSHEDDFLVAPVEVTTAIPLSLTGGVPTVTLWTLTVNATSTDNVTNATSFQATVDSGNSFNAYPVSLADAVNAAFDPPAVLIPDTVGQNLYSVDCNAKPPVHSVTIGNKTLIMPPEDMILQTATGCVSSIAGLPPNEDGLATYFLGAAWMRNLVSVFDFGKGEMRFATRIEIGSSNNGTSTYTGAAPRERKVRSSILWAMSLVAVCTVVVV